MTSKLGLIAAVVGLLWLVWQKIVDTYYQYDERKTQSKLKDIADTISKQAGQIQADRDEVTKAKEAYDKARSNIKSDK